MRQTEGTHQRSFFPDKRCFWYSFRTVVFCGFQILSKGRPHKDSEGVRTKVPRSIPASMPACEGAKRAMVCFVFGGSGASGIASVNQNKQSTHLQSMEQKNQHDVEQNGIKQRKPSNQYIYIYICIYIYRIVQALQSMRIRFPPRVPRNPERELRLVPVGAEAVPHCG